MSHGYRTEMIIMQKIGMVCILLFTFMMGSIEVNAKSASSQDRATWLWNPWMIVNDETGTLAFLESKQVNKVYVQIDQDISMNMYRSFIQKAKAKGIRIYALDGSAEWVAPKGYMRQNKLLNWLKSYQEGSTVLQQFSGIHLDIEPYLYSEWSSNQAKTIKSYQALILKAKNSSASLHLPLEIDLPFWFDEILYHNQYGKGNLAEWVIQQVDSVTIMAYRDSAPLIIDIVHNEMVYAEKYNKSIVIGVETGQTDEGPRISFFEEGESIMNQELDKVQDYYKQYSCFNGVAVHHVGSWMKMKQ